LEKMEKIYVTREGLDKMKAELAACKQRSTELVAAVEFARSLGDLRENGDYHAAKEEHGLVNARIGDLMDKLARAEVMDEGAMDTDKAYLGATVRVLNRKTDSEAKYVLVSPVEMDIDSGKISIRSPIGKALLGKAVGEVAVAKVPAGDIELEVLEISR
jgi:transcription elongation factor GreA